MGQVKLKMAKYFTQGFVSDYSQFWCQYEVFIAFFCCSLPDMGGGRCVKASADQVVLWDLVAGQKPLRQHKAD